MGMSVTPDSKDSKVLFVLWKRGQETRDTRLAADLFDSANRMHVSALDDLFHSDEMSAINIPLGRTFQSVCFGELCEKVLTLGESPGDRC